MEIYFASSNMHKFSEAKAVLSNHKLTHFPFDYNELRYDTPTEIAIDAVIEAYRRVKKPIFVEDSGLFIDSLNGFPGTFSAWALKKISLEGILTLLKNKTDRNSHFESSIAYHDGSNIHVFKGVTEGEISKLISGKDGFGYDPIFIPRGYDQTFAQSIELKNKLSHRYKSLLHFSKMLNGV